MVHCQQALVFLQALGTNRNRQYLWKKGPFGPFFNVSALSWRYRYRPALVGTSYHP